MSPSFSESRCFCFCFFCPDSRLPFHRARVHGLEGVCTELVRTDLRPELFFLCTEDSEVWIKPQGQVHSHVFLSLTSQLLVTKGWASIPLCVSRLSIARWRT